jgi:hypothetical protein
VPTLQGLVFAVVVDLSQPRFFDESGEVDGKVQVSPAKE